ncbi:MAG: trigger factor [Firmicutes bacterium]|nr:trigger factor [Bacillota bacterium]
MKKILALLLALALVFGLAACTKDGGDNGGSDSGEVPAYSQYMDENGFFEGVTAKDYVTLGQYEGIKVPADEVMVTTHQIEAEMDELLSSYSETKEVTDRAAQLGDTVDIDYEGYMDGEQFEGGTGNNPSLVLGSGSFIDGFEEGIVGHEVGDNFDLELNFPDPYLNNEELSGKAVTFIVTLNSISEEIAPTLTDAFVTMNFESEYGWRTVEEMRSGIEEQLKEDALYNYVLTQVDNFTVSEVPESMVQYEAGCMRVYYEQFAAMYGMTLDDFVSGMGVENFDGLVEMYREELTSSARSYLIYQAIAEDKGLTVTDEDVKAEFADMDESSYKDIVDYYGMPYIKCMMLNSKVAEMIRDSAVIE